MIHFPMSIQPAASTLQFQQPLPARRFNASTLLVAAFVTVVAGTLYFITAARDIVVGDSPELVITAATLGVPHSPGYPLFTMLGHFFSLLPTGPLPFRVNLFSVVCDAAAVGVVFLTAFRLSWSRLAAAMAALTLAFNPLFWSWSLVAEVFPLNNLLAALLIYLLVIWHEQPERYRFLTAASFVAGLALTNHQTIILLGPAVCFLLWHHRAVLVARPQIILTCAATFLLGLLPYTYVPWASAHHPVYNWGDVSSWRDLFALITRQSYGAAHLAQAKYQGGSWLLRLAALTESIGALMGLLLVLGAIYAYRRLTWYFWFALLAFVFAGPFFTGITNFNLVRSPSGLFVLERFFLLPRVIVAPLMALGLVMIAEMVRRYAPAIPMPPLRVVSGVIVVVLAVSVFTNYRQIDQSHNHIARSYAEDLFATAEPDTILLVTGDGPALPPLYLNIIEKVRPDLTLIVAPMLPGDWYIRQLRRHHPRLKIPFDYYDGRQNNLKALVEANPDRPLAIVGPPPDNSLDQDYWPRPRGLVNLVQPKSKPLTLEQMMADNEELLNRYHRYSLRKIKWKTFEGEIMELYAVPLWRIGHEQERAGAMAEARTWYQRALAIDPNYPQARQAMARIQQSDVR